MNSVSELSRSGGCSESDRLVQFVNGLLPESDAASLAAHADACPDCQNVLAELDQKQHGLIGWLQRASPTPMFDRSEARDPRRSFDETEILTATQGTGLADVSAPDANLSRLIRRLEQLPKDRSVDQPDWMGWAQSTLGFGPDGLPEFPQYRLQSVLGAGGMGVVFGVFDTSLGRGVALKVLRPEMAGKVAVHERFLREAQAMAALRHDQVVRVFQTGTLSAGTLGTLPFLTMERVSGETLAQRLSRGPALTLAESLQISRDVARGLAEAHRLGMIHRDVKPENVFLEGTIDCFQVKLLDFGLARDVSKTDLDDEHGWVLGTPAFMSPEQARGEAVTERTDLFSLGCVMYRMLAGRLPYTGDTPQEMLRARLDHSPVALQTLVPAIPGVVARLIDELLSGDASRRPPSSVDVARRLERIVGDLRPTASRTKRRLPLIPVAAAAIVLLTVATILMSGRGERGFSGPDGLTSESASNSADGQPGTQPGRAGGEPATRTGSSSAAPPNPTGGVLIEPLDPGWLERVSGLAADEQVAEVVAELRRRNPDWGGEFEVEIPETVVNRFRMLPPGLRDVSPVRAFPKLKHLQFPAGAAHEGNPPGEVTDLSPLRGMSLSILDCGNNPITDFSPLRGMPLSILRAKSTLVSDLSPLSELPLRVLQLAETPVEDLTPIKGCPLWLLSFWSTRVSDLSPLAEMTTLTRLECERTLVTDLSPLSGLKLKHLACQESPIEDYSILATFPLEELHITYDRDTHRNLLLSIPTLKKLNYKPPELLLK